MRRSAPIAKRLIPGMFLAGVIRSIPVGFVVWLVTGLEFFIEVIIARLMIENAAHGEF